MEQYKENSIETPVEKIDKLTVLLSEYLDKKVNLDYGDHTTKYCMSLADWGHVQLVVNVHDGDESTQLLTDIYNAYLIKKPTSEERIYDTPRSDKTTNSVTEETMEDASFVLKDFLEDMKEYLSKE